MYLPEPFLCNIASNPGYDSMTAKSDKPNRIKSAQNEVYFTSTKDHQCLKYTLEARGLFRHTK